MRSLFVLATLTVATFGQDLVFPVVLPPYGTSGVDPSSPDVQWGDCLLYLESLHIYVYKKNDRQGLSAVVNSAAKDGKNTFVFNKDYVKCPNATFATGSDSSKAWKPTVYEFTIDAKLGKPVEAKDRDDKVAFTVDGPVLLNVKLTTVRDATWKLVEFSLPKGLTVKKGGFLTKDITVKSGAKAKNASITDLAIGSFNNYNYACSLTKAAWFLKNEDDKEYDVGVAFGNIQIQRDGIQKSKEGKNVRFSFNTNDCVGTFSAGSWMGIIVAIILATVLMFGFLMLNSVQTIDRYDDPKQKQLIINSKD